MRIEKLVVTPIALGDPPLLNANGLHAPYALRIVLELVTESGIVGLSEIPGDPAVLEAFERLSPALAGASVFETRLVERRILEALGDPAREARGDLSFDRRRSVHVASAIEVGCLDAIGKRFGCRVVDLLGGAVRERVPYSGYLFFKYEGAGGPLGFDQDPKASGWAAARQAPAL